MGIPSKSGIRRAELVRGSKGSVPGKHIRRCGRWSHQAEQAVLLCDLRRNQKQDLESYRCRAWLDGRVFPNTSNDGATARRFLGQIQPEWNFAADLRSYV